MKRSRFHLFSVILFAMLVAVASRPVAAQIPDNIRIARQEMGQLFSAGMKATDQQDYQKALEAWGAALNKAVSVRDDYSVGVFSDAVGTTYGKLHQVDKAIQLLNQAIKIKSQDTDKVNLARSYNNLSVVYIDAGQPAKAVESAAHAVQSAEESKDKGSIAFMLEGYASALMENGQYSQCMETLRRSLGLREELKNPHDIRVTNNRIAVLYQRMGDSAQAAALFEKLVEAAQAEGDKRGVAASCNGLANANINLGQYDKALAYVNRAIDNWKALGAKHEMAGNIDLLGSVYLRMGQYDRALDTYKRALTLGQESGDLPENASALNNMAIVYDVLGQRKKSLELYGRSLEIDLQLNAERNAALVISNMGQIYLQDGDPDTALTLFQRVLPIEEKYGNKLTIAETLDSMAEALDRLHRTQDALGVSQRAYELKKGAGNKHAIAVSLNSLGNLYREMGQTDKAIESYTASLEIRKALGNRREAAVAYNNLATIYFDKGDLEKSEQAFAATLENNEAISQQVQEASQVGAFQQTALRGAYTRYAALLLRRNRPEDALVMAERGRGQGLARQAARNRRDYSRFLSQDDADLMRYALNEYSLASADWKRAEDLESLADSAQTDDVKRQILALRKRYDDAERKLTTVRKQLSEKYPAFRQMVNPLPPAVAEIHALPEQHPDTLYLEWAVGEEGTSWLFSLSKRDGLKTFALPAGQAALRKMVAAWREALTDPRSDPAAESSLAKQLYAVLFSEVEKAGQLSNDQIKRLVLIGDGPILDVPFAALMDAQGKRLIDKMPLSVSVSLGTLTLPTEVIKPTSAFFCVADPLGGGRAKNSERIATAPLPGARQEGKALAALFASSSLLIGDEATRPVVEKRIGAYAILHFATHGALDDEDGLRSGLVLAPQNADDTDADVLEAGQIMNQRLSAQLATLSACETARGQASGGEGLLGLSWAFRAAGCPSVVASQWSVEDTATMRLMVNFYTALKAGKRKDEALRSAMLAVKGEAVHAHPFYWAAFQLLGDTSELKLP